MNRRMDALQVWAEKSVWSMVCAMELGLISEANQRSRLDTATAISTGGSIDVVATRSPANHASSQSSNRTHAYLNHDSLPKPANRHRRRKPPSRRFASTARKSRRNVLAGRKTRLVTVDKFWKSRKSRLGACGKWTSRGVDQPDRFPYYTRSANLTRPIDRENGVSRASKRKRIDGKDLDAAPQHPVREEQSDPYPANTVNDPPTDIRSKEIIDAFESSTSINEGKEGTEETRALVLPEDVENEERCSRETDIALIANRAWKEPLENGWSVEFEDIHTLPLAERISDENGSNATTEPVKKSPKTEALRVKTCKGNEEYHELRRVTRRSTKLGKDLFVGKLIWGYCSGWWPALIIDADHVGMLSEAGKLWVYWIGEARISLLNEKTQIEPFSSNLESRLTHNLNIPRIHAIDATMQILRKRLGSALTKPYFSWIQNNYSNAIETLDEMKLYPYPIKIQQRLDQLKEKNGKVTEKYLLEQKRESQVKKWTEKPKDRPQSSNVDPTRLPLKEQNAGIIAWAKIAGHNWWPAMIIDYRDCCMREPSFGCQWIMWYGDYKLSEVHHQLFLKFDKGMEKMRDYINNTKKHIYLVGVLQASKDYCFRLGLETESWTLDDALRYFFSKSNRSRASHDPSEPTNSAKIYGKYSAHIVSKLNELKNNPNEDEERTEEISNSEDLRSAINGNIGFESLCLKCLKVAGDGREIHPFFEGSLCKNCSERYKPCMFVFGNDAKCFYCTVCAASGMMIICDKEDCPRVYCTACMKHLLCPATYQQVLQEDPWQCFLCASKSPSFPDMIVRPRGNWKDKIINMFRTNCDSNVQQLLERSNPEKRKIRVLSLFDGLATGLLVLLKLGLAVDVYYASEIDPDALMVSASHFGDRIVPLGNVKDITEKMIGEMAPIDLLIGGSPCNDLSLANPARLGLHDPNGTGVLFFEYRRILQLVKKKNNARHLFWLYENVASMPSEYRLEINKHLGQEPDVIDSADFSPQHRLRLYWHNLPIEPRSLPFRGEQDVQDILTPHCQRYSLVKKIRTVTTKVNSLKQGKLALKPILMKDESDSLWITELEEIFGFPRHYTDVKNLSATKRQRLIGKSWSVQTLSAILTSLCPFFECSMDETNQRNRYTPDNTEN